MSMQNLVIFGNFFDKFAPFPNYSTRFLVMKIAVLYIIIHGEAQGITYLSLGPYGRLEKKLTLRHFPENWVLQKNKAMAPRSSPDNSEPD